MAGLLAAEGCVDNKYNVRCYVLAIIFVPCGHFEQRPRLLHRRPLDPLVEARTLVVPVLLGVCNDFKHPLDLILPRLERLRGVGSDRWFINLHP